MKNNNILEMNEITKQYPGVIALDHVSISACYGEVHALMGENGAGKSTLMKVLSGAHRADSGEIWFDGERVVIHNQSEALQKGISMIYQEVSCIPDLSIMENIYTGVHFPRKIKGIVDWKCAGKQCRELFQKLDLHYDPKTKMRSLSVADVQMIAIVKAIAFHAKLIIMDEPTSALTEKETKKLFQFIRKLKAQGITIIIITHKLGEVFEIADRVSILRDGKMIGTKCIGDITRQQMINMMAGRDVNTIYEQKDFQTGPVILRAEHICKGKNVKNVSFSVRRGEILGFSGIMGAGRTETMNCLFGLDRMDSGTVWLNDQKLRIRDVRDAVKHGIMMVTEDRKKDGLVLCRSIYENMLLPSTYKNSWHGILPEKKEGAIVRDYYRRLSVKSPSVSTLTNQLSGGNQQKVIIAKWLLLNPAVLILDEPTRGIDVATKFEIYRLMKELNRAGVAIILVSSDMEELLGVSDRIAVMCQGEITGIFDKAEFDQNKIMEYATMKD